MFIRKVKTGTRKDGGSYVGYRLVHGIRQGRKVRQKTLLHLGSRFPVEEKDWPALCSRINERLKGQLRLDSPLPKLVEDQAALIANRLLANQGERLTSTNLAERVEQGPVWRTVDVRSVRMTNPRSVGVEHVALWALEELGVPGLLTKLNFSRGQRNAALGSIVGRLAKPGSEHATHEWLCARSGLGEFLQCRFESIGLKQLYRVSNRLLLHREAIETHVSGQALELFELQRTVTLFDLTNTYLEGSAKRQKRAKRGHSKEKRSDCPLITLALVIDGSGFVERSRVFDGNVAESKTLEQMLRDLKAPKSAAVVMDRGIATAANVEYLKSQGYKYVVVSRERKRIFDPKDQPVSELKNGLSLYMERHGDEQRVYCRSVQRVKKEEAIVKRCRDSFENKLAKLDEGLSKPRARTSVVAVWKRIGRMIANSGGMGQHYEITVETDEAEERVVKVNWTYEAQPNTMASTPGVYCLRTNMLDMEAEALWRTYVMLTDLESVFRSLKSELGLRPIYHRTDRRTEGHLFITVLAYQVVQVIRLRLRQKGLTLSWSRLRERLSSQTRASFSQKQQDGKTVQTRVTSDPDIYQREIYLALGLNPVPLNPDTLTL